MKAKMMLDSVNSAVNSEHGNIVFINSGDRHVYQLNYAVRLIDASEYAIKTYREFICFLNGALSQNYDITHIFIDSLLKVVDDNIDNPYSMFYAICFDRKGKLGWKSNQIIDEDDGYNKAAIIEVLTEQVDVRYLRYLKSLKMTFSNR